MYECISIFFKIYFFVISVSPSYETLPKRVVLVKE